MKRLIFLLILLIMLFSACSCAAPQQAPVEVPNTEPTPASTPEPTPETLHPVVNEENYIIPLEPVENVQEVIESNSYDINEEITIPVYSDDEMFMGNIDGRTLQFTAFWTGYDGYIFESQYDSCKKADYLLANYPNGAWRNMEDGRKYLMCDSDKGARLFFFFSDSDNYEFPKGYVVFMTQRLSYADFAEIEIGNTAADVMEIDSSSKYTLNCLDQLSEGYIQNHIDNWGHTITTVHLLTDGILKYTYERSGEEGNYVYTIVDIEYHENFKMEGLGGVTDYSIAEIDYVD